VVRADGSGGVRWEDRSMSSLSSALPATDADASAATIARVLLDAAATHRGVAMRVRGESPWSETTFAELGAAGTEVAAGLIDLGIRPGDRVGILGETRPEWTIADCGALCAGATFVPVYRRLPRRSAATYSSTPACGS
jgi:long-subunit acyl-CoA synthetase (AMP-forming)